MSTSTSAAAEPLSPTTGEPASVVARRNRLAMWLIIVSCSAGTLSLLIAYAYLWSLNVNGAWAADWKFWAITAGLVVAALLLWQSARVLARGEAKAAVSLTGLATVVLLVLFVGQVLQVATFPFGPQDGAYASATLWLALANTIWLLLAVFLAFGLMNRVRVGRITQGDPSQLRFVAMFVTYLCVAALLGSLFATAMKASPNQSSPPFGTFSS